MTDVDPQSTPLAAAAAPVVAQHTAPSDPPPAWKPEPRQWSWKDLFTAPMLAFKPKCMLVSAVTLLLIGLWLMAFLEPLPGSKHSLQYQLQNMYTSLVWFYLVAWLWLAVGLTIFSLGATFVSVFLKADLLDDEFLSFKEAWAQFVPRLVPALLVPLFLLVLITGLWSAIWLGSLICSIPYAGSVMYALLWPIAFGAAILGVLIGFAVVLSCFLFPGIIAVRRHGWFDNVVDTIEAVGTKPHLLVASIALTYLLLYASFFIGTSAIGGLSKIAGSLPSFTTGNQIEQVDTFAAVRRNEWLHPFEVGTNVNLDMGRIKASDYYSNRDMIGSYSGFIQWGPGLVVAVWQTLIIALLLGYCMNLALSGGMLTYLWVREDDYWDDEDLQDLDQLAKELEEEAKREDARGKTQSTVAE